MDQTDEKKQISSQFGLGADELSAFATAAGIEGVEQTALMTFALSIAEECAEIGDHYLQNGRTCGDAIRSRFGLG